MVYLPRVQHMHLCVTLAVCAARLSSTHVDTRTHTHTNNSKSALLIIKKQVLLYAGYVLEAMGQGCEDA